MILFFVLSFLFCSSLACRTGYVQKVWLWLWALIWRADAPPACVSDVVKHGGSRLLFAVFNSTTVDWRQESLVSPWVSYRSSIVNLSLSVTSSVRQCTGCRTDLTFPVITRTWGRLSLTAHRGFISGAWLACVSAFFSVMFVSIDLQFFHRQCSTKFLQVKGPNRAVGK